MNNAHNLVGLALFHICDLGVDHTLIIYCSFAVWGGDPVYPTINYIQDPDAVIDYRGPDFHEPTPNMLAYLMEVGFGLFNNFTTTSYQVI